MLADPTAPTSSVDGKPDHDTGAARIPVINPATGERTANAVDAGSVWTNDHGSTATEIPFGGFKQSGIGRDLSKYAVEEHTELKHIAVTLQEVS